MSFPSDVPERRMLASDAERERVAVVLRDAAAEGRLSSNELTERLGLAYRARTAGDLQKLTQDLPAAPARPPSLAQPGPVRGDRLVLAIMSGRKRRGRWRLGRRCLALAVMGGCTLDLRQAEIAGPHVSINAISVMGGIEIIVPEGVEVSLSGIALMGGKRARIADVPIQPGSPVIHVNAVALMGGVAVKSAPQPPASSGPARLPA